ncbi:phosphatidate cytidylyltransferase [Azonexus sp.]|uniref:phosphatidate cytidylyltransferase n=1 Tax=Azonexus sp. TaxID=1872668 RepID=UPI0039E4E50C
MLKTRVITALVLVGLLLPSMFWLPPLGWALLIAAVIGVAAWEWGALLGWGQNARRILGGAVALLCAALTQIDPAALGIAGFAPDAAWVLAAYALSVVFWLFVVPLWLNRQWPLSGIAGVFVGALVLLPTWLALVQLRALHPGALLAVMALVWVADIAAYFAGRKFGKNKLAPSISPGKTQEGALGAFIGVMLYGLVIGHFLLAGKVPLTAWMLALLLATLVSIVGDLFESLLKRKAGLKDSSHILPGHGGVLDRIDSLTSTLPLAALAWLMALYPA